MKTTAKQPESSLVAQAKVNKQDSVNSILQRYKDKTTQLHSADEEELLQGKFETAQKMDLDEEPLQGKFETTQLVAQDEEEPLQRQPNNTGLPDNLKNGIENLSGYSMDDVKVHYNSLQPATLQAHAYAQGTDIHIAPGQEKHLAHEAWHVVQQKQGRVKPTMQMKGNVNVNDDVGLEKEADVMGLNAYRNQNNNIIQSKKNGHFSKVIQRDVVTVGNAVNGQDYLIGINIMPSTNMRTILSMPQRIYSTNLIGDIFAGHTSILSGALTPNSQPLLNNRANQGSVRDHYSQQSLNNPRTIGFAPNGLLNSLNIAISSSMQSKILTNIFGGGIMGVLGAGLVSTLEGGSTGLLRGGLTGALIGGLTGALGRGINGNSQVPGIMQPDLNVTDDPLSRQITTRVTRETYDLWQVYMNSLEGVNGIYTFAPDANNTNNCTTFAIDFACSICIEMLNDPQNHIDFENISVLWAELDNMRTLLRDRISNSPQNSRLQGGIMAFSNNQYPLA